METIVQRLIELKKLAAGDEQCQDCLAMSMNPMSVCRKCIAETPAFTALVSRLTASKNEVSSNYGV